MGTDSGNVPSLAVPRGPFAITAGGTITAPSPNSPQQLYCVRVDNSSPYTLRVVAGVPLGQVGAFESHVFVLPQGAYTPVSVTAVAGSGVTVFGTDSTVYFTWYDSPPFGSWPSALGSAGVTATPTRQIANIPVNVGGGAPGIQTVHLGPVLLPYDLTLFLRYSSPGLLSALGIFVQVTEAFGPGGTDPQVINFSEVLIGAPASAPPGIAPTVGTPTDVVITIQPFDPAVNSTGNLLIYAAPAASLYYEVPTMPAESGGTGPTNVAGGATTQVLAFPAIGYVWKVKSLSVNFGNVAAASAGRWLMATTGQAIATMGAPVGNQVNNPPIPLDMFVNDAINFQNVTTVNAQVAVAWELWPITIGFGGVPS